jgi:hypothetical protein
MKYRAIMMMGSALLAFASPAFASGSMGGGSPSVPLGQRVYMKEIACSACAFAGGLKTRDQVDMALAKINSGEISLKAVITFINRRFRGL